MFQRVTFLFSAAAVVMLPTLASAAPILFSVGGDTTAASIQGVVDAFRAALGDPNNRNNPGPLPAAAARSTGMVVVTISLRQHR